jgi:hypothetical protein
MLPYKAAVNSLLEELRAGKGKDETRASFENVHQARRDLILTMGGAWSPTVETMRQIARSAATLARLDRFYIDPSAPRR